MRPVGWGRACVSNPLRYVENGPLVVGLPDGGYRVSNPLRYVENSGDVVVEAVSRNVSNPLRYVENPCERPRGHVLNAAFQTLLGT